MLWWQRQPLAAARHSAAEPADSAPASTMSIQMFDSCRTRVVTNWNTVKELEAVNLVGT